MNGVPVDEGGRMDVEGVADGRGNGHTMLEEGAGTAEEEGEEEWDGIMDVDDNNNPEPLDFSNDDEDDLPNFFTRQQQQVTNSNNKNGSNSSKRKIKGKVAELVREKVRKVLEDDTELADRRARTLDQNDFLSLLLAFNKEGIHFA
ncbi:MAG: hypothetical protein L6R41_008446 [Letrouitia leprolyta]|nr:MAG: hypothetical protein L6R41_008446 [Letrouitia leprolyta]